MEKGNYVTIVPNGKHNECVKANYGKVLEIEEVLISSKNVPLYKIEGISDYALKQDLKLIAYQIMDKFAKTFLSFINNTFEKFVFIEKIGNIYFFGVEGYKYEGEPIEEGGNLAYFYQNNVIVVDKSCIEIGENMKKILIDRDIDLNDTETSKAVTAAFHVFSDLRKAGY